MQTQSKNWPGVQYPLKNVGYSSWCIKDIRETKSGTEKKLRALNILVPLAQMALELLAHFDPYFSSHTTDRARTLPIRNLCF